jgi:hypothetical protein
VPFTRCKDVDDQTDGSNCAVVLVDDDREERSE